MAHVILWPEVGMRWGLCVGTWVALAACGVDNVTVEDLDGVDISAALDIPSDGCPINWVPIVTEDIVARRVRWEAGGLTIAPDGGEVELRGLVGAAPQLGAGFVLRLDFGAIVLGPDGRLKVELVAPSGPIATLNVQAAGAVLLVESFPDGNLAELELDGAPERVAFVLQSGADLSLSGRAFFGATGRGQVLEAAVARFEGGFVTATISVYGDAEVRLERFAAIDASGGGTIDDLACRSLGSTLGQEDWPATRVAKVGAACAGDVDCGAGEVCDGVCRRACLGSAECPGSVCLVRDDGGTCRIAEDCDDLEPGLVCGPDDAPRLGCTSADDCPRVTDLCVGGACVNNDESAASDGLAWGECELDSERCGGDEVQVCDRGGPGWNKVERCDRDECVVVDGDARCDDCFRSCIGGDVWAQCGEETEPHLDVACVAPGQACSIGDDGRLPAHCRATVAPSEPGALVTVEGWQIGATEVTRGEYASFLASPPPIAGQGPECAWNTTFEPIGWPWFDSPRRAAQVDFCDARAYCASIGARLCPTPTWYLSCSAGGTLDWPYGDTFETGRCSNDTKREVASSPGCTTTVVGFTGVFDLIGGVGEWLDACGTGSPDGPASDSCKTRGTLPAEGCGAERTVRRDSIAGIRCCVTP